MRGSEELVEIAGFREAKLDAKLLPDKLIAKN